MITIIIIMIDMILLLQPGLLLLRLGLLNEGPGLDGLSLPLVDGLELYIMLK